MKITDRIRLDLPASYTYLNILGACIGGVIERVEGLEAADVTSYNMQLAATEVFTNIVGHAYGGDASQRVLVEIGLADAPRGCVIELRDSGAPFDPAGVAQPDLDNAQVHGYGLFLVEQLLDGVQYTAGADGNCWRLTKLF